MFYHILKNFLVLNPFLLDPDSDPYRFCQDPDPDPIKVRPGSGSVTNFLTSWIRIRIKMIRIRHTADHS